MLHLSVGIGELKMAYIARATPWHLDLTFGEDDSRVRKDNGPMNLNIFRKFGLFLLAHEPTKISLKRKRKKAARDNSFMIEILKSA